MKTLIFSYCAATIYLCYMDMLEDSCTDSQGRWSLKFQ